MRARVQPLVEKVPSLLEQGASKNHDASRPVANLVILGCERQVGDDVQIYKRPGSAHLPTQRVLRSALRYSCSMRILARMVAPSLLIVTSPSGLTSIFRAVQTGEAAGKLPTRTRVPYDKNRKDAPFGPGDVRRMLETARAAEDVGLLRIEALQSGLCLLVSDDDERSAILVKH